MRKYKIVLITLACAAAIFISSCVVASAATLTGESVTYVPDTISLIIKGTIPDANKIKPVTIIIYRPGFTPQMLDNGTTALDAVSNIKNVIRESDGSFEWKYDLNQTGNIIDKTVISKPDLLGEYTVRFKLEDIDKTITVYVGDKAAIGAAILEINNSGSLSIAEKRAIYEKDRAILNLSTAVYDKIQVAAAKDAVIDKVISGQYTIPSEVQNAFIKESVKQLIGNASTNDDIAFLIANYNDILKIDLENQWYLKKVVNDDQLQRLYTTVRTGGPYQEFINAANQFQKGVIVESVNAFEAPGEIYDILSDTTNNALLKIDFKPFNDLIYNDPVLNQMASHRDYKTCEEIVKAWNDAVKAEKRKESDSGNTGNPGSPARPTTNPDPIKLPTGSEENIQMPKPNTLDNGAKFNDLGSVPWAADSIVSLADAGIVNGTSDTTFSPNDNITREEFIKMLYLSANLTIDENAETSFKDVDKDKWYYSYIASAQSMNLINGISDSEFGVGEKITREDMAVMVVRLVSTLAGKELPQVNEKVSFKDDGTIQNYAKESVYAMQRAGIINGYMDQTFAPDALATRAEAAKIIFQLCKLIMR